MICFTCIDLEREVQTTPLKFVKLFNAQTKPTKSYLMYKINQLKGTLETPLPNRKCGFVLSWYEKCHRNEGMMHKNPHSMAEINFHF